MGVTAWLVRMGNYTRAGHSLIGIRPVVNVQLQAPLRSGAFFLSSTKLGPQPPQPRLTHTLRATDTFGDARKRPPCRFGFVLRAALVRVCVEHQFRSRDYSAIPQNLNGASLYRPREFRRRHAVTNRACCDSESANPRNYPSRHFRIVASCAVQPQRYRVGCCSCAGPIAPTAAARQWTRTT
jgi:hypothetical protein